MSAAAAALLPACGRGAETKSGAGAAVDGPPETTTFRLAKTPIACTAGQAVAAEFLTQEGFIDVQYFDPGSPRDIFAKFSAGAFDMILYPAPMAAVRVDAGDQVVILGGINAGCFQILGAPGINSIRDLKGKRVGTGGPGIPDHVFLAVTLANVGIDIRTDVTVVPYSAEQAPQLLASGEVDGLTALPPFSHEIRARGIGHVILDANVDRPWSQYLYSMPTVHREFIEQNPVATKRALRAILKGVDVVAKDPERGARAMLDLGHIDEGRYEATREELRTIPYNVWRVYNPVDTLRFYGLRLQEAGQITSTPEEIISRGTDFRFLRALKEELKGG